MYKYGIVAIGYNRPDSMKRLLTALESAAYQGEQIMLIVSIDNCGNDAVEQVAKAASWSHGEKVIRTFPVRQGLRNHILKCGSVLEEYDLDAVAVFEDDVVPSPAFFSYMAQCTERYADNEDIVGISLYKHGTNVSAKLPFLPQPSQYDVFFMQFAQSWGQVWMRKQWKAFADWYASSENDHVFDPKQLPAYVCRWPESSWLKYHIKYCVEKNKFFVYPYFSYTTCFSEAGEHTDATTSLLQVPVLMKAIADLRLPEQIADSVVYDAFFEYMDGSDVCYDLYGIRQDYGENSKLLSARKLPYRVIESYGLTLKPHEMNYLSKQVGEDIYLYDLSTSNAEGASAEENALKKVYFYFNYFPGVKLSCYVLYALIGKKLKQTMQRFKKMLRLTRK